MPQVLVTHNEDGLCPICNAYYAKISLMYAWDAFDGLWKCKAILYIHSDDTKASIRQTRHLIIHRAEVRAPGRTAKNKQAQNKQPVVAGARQPVAEAEVQIFCRGVEFHPLSRGIIRPRSHGGELHPLSRGNIHTRCRGASFTCDVAVQVRHLLPFQLARLYCISD